MSTEDPIAALRTKRLKRQGQPQFLVWAIVTGVAQLCAAFCCGLAIGTLVDLLRSGVIGSGFADIDPAVESGFLGLATLPVLLAVGTFGLVLTAGVTRYLIDAYSGGEKQPIRQTPVVLLTIAAGLIADTTTWTTPPRLGTEFDPLFPEEEESLSAFGWVMYHADRWLPALLVLIAALVAAYAIKYNRRLRLQIADRNRLLTDGRKVAGAITDVSIRTSENNEGHRSVVGADVVVKFTDLQGTDRWVTRRAANRSAIPTSDTALVLFDPLHPEVDDFIFVAFQPAPLPGDWIGSIA